MVNSLVLSMTPGTPMCSGSFRPAALGDRPVLPGGEVEAHLRAGEPRNAGFLQQRLLRMQRFVHDRLLDERVAVGIRSDADAAETVVGVEEVAQERHHSVVGAHRFGGVAGNQEHLGEAVVAAERTEALHRCCVLGEPGGEVRHRHVAQIHDASSEVERRLLALRRAARHRDRCPGRDELDL